MGGNNEDAVPPSTSDKNPTNLTESEGKQKAAQVETPHLATPLDTVPTLMHPTREFLDKNYLRSDLQKRCRELGIKNIWTTKNQLIEMIMEKLQSESRDTESPPLLTSDATPTRSTQNLQDTTANHEDNAESEDLSLMHMAREIKMIKSKLATKEMEIDLLSTEVKAAYHTIEQLQQRVTELEHHQCDNGGNQHTDTCLLLGDSNLRSIYNSDLHHSSSVKTIPGANMDLLKCWVSEKLRKSPSECIIHCGSTDILEEHSSATILDNLGSLISNLKEKNNTMKVYVCQVAPYSTQKEIQEKIRSFNDHLATWSKTNGIPVIDTVPILTLGTGELDDLCFDKGTDSNFWLNRLGAIKLLTTINRQCPQLKLCDNWEIKRKAHTTTTQVNELRSTGQAQDNTRPTPPLPTPSAATPANQTHLPVLRTNNPYARSTSQRTTFTSHRPASHRPSTAPAVSHYAPERTKMRQQWTNEDEERSERDSHSYAAAVSGAAITRYHTAHNRSLVHSSGGRGRYGENSPPSQTPPSVRRERDHYSTIDDSRRYQNDSGGHTYALRNTVHNNRLQNVKVGCYNCGEYNHIQVNCRFDHKLSCGICRRLGHKSRLCQYYTP